jgi:hypothetical protein
VNRTILQQAIHAAPFRPFGLVLADGSLVAVPHPEWIAFAGGRTAIVIEPDDRSHFIDVMLVTKLELAPPAPAGSISPNPNGGE